MTLELWDICSRYHHSEPHSVLAHKGLRSNKARQLQTILAAIRRQGNATCQEIETLLRLPHESVSARFSDLKRLGLIEPDGERPTRSGSMAGVWRVKTI